MLKKNSRRQEIDTLKAAQTKLGGQVQEKIQSPMKRGNKDLRKNNLVIEGVLEKPKEDTRLIVPQIIHDTGEHIQDIELDTVCAHTHIQSYSKTSL